MKRTAPIRSSMIVSSAVAPVIVKVRDNSAASEKRESRPTYSILDLILTKPPSAAATPGAAGESSVSASVTIVWEIR